MTIQECYAMLHGSYEDAKSRLMSDRLVEKFMLKYPQDPTMQELRDSLAAQDYDTAFRAAHTLKGVAANLAFTELQAAASELTEAMRNNRTKPDDALVQSVEAAYALVIETLKKYQDGRQYHFIRSGEACPDRRRVPFLRAGV